MADEHYIEITDRAHAARINRWVGAANAVAVVEQKAKEFERLPGFGLALALLQKETAELRSIAVMENLRAVARAGHNVATAKTVELETGANGSLRLKVTMMDLADLAEASDG